MKLWNIIYNLELIRSEEMDISVKCLGNESPNLLEDDFKQLNRNTTQSERDVLDVVFKYLLIPQKVQGMCLQFLNVTLVPLQMAKLSPFLNICKLFLETWQQFKMTQAFSWKLLLLQNKWPHYFSTKKKNQSWRKKNVKNDNKSSSIHKIVLTFCPFL